MLNNGASLSICRYSDEPFNTAKILGSHWNEIPSHLSSVAVFLSLTLLIIGCGSLAAQRRHQVFQNEYTS
jgi:hypothetical protein